MAITNNFNVDIQVFVLIDTSKSYTCTAFWQMGQSLIILYLLFLPNDNIFEDFNIACGE